MLRTAVHILLATSALSCISLIGLVFLSVRETFLRQIAALLVAFASGALIGGVFFHLIPEALALAGEQVYPLIVFGIVLFFVLEKFLYWRHCHAGICETHNFTYLNLIGDGFHNFLDGMLIAGGFLVSVELGMVTTTVVALHEIPQELGDFGILIYGGFTRTKALSFNFLSALSAVVGGMSTYFFSVYVHALQAPLLALAAGGFLYVALVDLLPELHKQRKLSEAISQLTLMLFGISILWIARLVVHD